MYRYHSTSNQVIAVTTYAGKTVRAVAKCNPEDEFDLEKGKALATARCAVKVAEKRMKRACRKHDESARLVNEAIEHNMNMAHYEADATKAFNQATFELANLESMM